MASREGQQLDLALKEGATKRMHLLCALGAT